MYKTLWSLASIACTFIALTFFIADCNAASAPIEEPLTQVQSPVVIEAWSYYQSPPFQIKPDSDTGLAYDFINYLNQHLAGTYLFKLVQIPKARLNIMLEHNDRGMVLFTPDVIFGGVENQQYLWSSSLLSDQQDVLSKKSHPINYVGPASLYGLSFGCTLGHVYPAIQNDIEAGKIDCQWAPYETLLIPMLSNDHVSAITLPNSTTRYLLKEDPKIAEWIYISAGNLGKFQRRLMFQKSMTRERDDIDKVVKRMQYDAEWIAILSKYGLKTP